MTVLSVVLLLVAIGFIIFITRPRHKNFSHEDPEYIKLTYERDRLLNKLAQLEQARDAELDEEKRDRIQEDILEKFRALAEITAEINAKLRQLQK